MPPTKGRLSIDNSIRNQRRRAHKKSRAGCGNCKFRRVKCDELKPSCKKCSDYGVCCNYGSEVQELHMTFGGLSTTTFRTQEPASSGSQKEGVPLSLRPPILVDFDSDSLDRLLRFQERTVLTIGTPTASRFYQTIVFELACCALTASHDRHLSVPFNHEQSAFESYHLSRGCALFNQKLCSPLQDKDRDPLWSCASLLGAIAFSWVHASKPEDVWPLSAAKSTDLEWVTMSESKMVIWTLCDPLRPGSIFNALSEIYLVARESEPTSLEGITGNTLDLALLCEVDELSTASNNPYCRALHILIPLLELDCEQKVIMKFLGFIAKMHPDYKLRLKQKDPRALLILVYWYSKVRHVAWWLGRRALLEGQAICMYLERYYAGDYMIQKLLQEPKLTLWPVDSRDCSTTSSSELV